MHWRGRALALCCINRLRMLRVVPPLPHNTAAPPPPPPPPAGFVAVTMQPQALRVEYWGIQHTDQPLFAIDVPPR